MLWYSSLLNVGKIVGCCWVGTSNIVRVGLPTDGEKQGKRVNCLEKCPAGKTHGIIAVGARQTDILLTEKKSHYKLICHRNRCGKINHCVCYFEAPTEMIEGYFSCQFVFLARLLSFI